MRHECNRNYYQIFLVYAKGTTLGATVSVEHSLCAPADPKILISFLFTLPPRPETWSIGSMRRSSVPTLLHLPRVVLPARRDLASDAGLFLFDREAPRASAHSLRSHLSPSFPYHHIHLRFPVPYHAVVVPCPFSKSSTRFSIPRNIVNSKVNSLHCRRSSHKARAGPPRDLQDTSFSSAATHKEWLTLTTIIKTIIDET